jgi:hypothetical protein
MAQLFAPDIGDIATSDVLAALETLLSSAA